MKREAVNKNSAPTSVSHEEQVVKKLRESPEFLREYLVAALEDKEEPRVFESALRQVVKAMKDRF